MMDKAIVIILLYKNYVKALNHRANALLEKKVSDLFYGKLMAQQILPNIAIVVYNILFLNHVLNDICSRGKLTNNSSLHSSQLQVYAELS